MRQVGGRIAAAVCEENSNKNYGKVYSILADCEGKKRRLNIMKYENFLFIPN